MRLIRGPAKLMVCVYGLSSRRGCCDDGERRDITASFLPSCVVLLLSFSLSFVRAMLVYPVEEGFCPQARHSRANLLEY